MAITKWYTLHVFSQHEEKVKKSILDRFSNNKKDDEIKEVYIPKKIEYETDNKGKTHEKSRILFPGYVYINMKLTDENWHLVKQTEGVTGFIGGERPTPLRRGEIETLKASLEDKPAQTNSKWAPGDQVIIRNGSFTDYDGKVKTVKDNSVVVVIDFFDRPTDVELDFRDIEKV